MFAKKILSARSGADHCLEASHADEEGSRSRQREDIREIRLQSRRTNSLAPPRIPLRTAVPQCLSLRAAKAAPAHFPSMSVRSASLCSTILPCSRSPASSEATRSRSSSSLSRRASTQIPKQDQPVRPFAPDLFRTFRAEARGQDAPVPRVPEEPLHGFHVALVHAPVAGTAKTVAGQERPRHAWRDGARSVSWRTKL